MKHGQTQIKFIHSVWNNEELPEQCSGQSYIFVRRATKRSLVVYALCTDLNPKSCHQM